VQINATPKAQFDIGGNEEIPFDAGSPPRLIVTSPTASIQQQQPTPILKQPTVISSESIADRVKRRRGTPSSSIAERVAQQRRESAKPTSTSTPVNYLNIVSCCETPNTKKIGLKQEQMNLAG
jgi:hypothetical protein